MNLEHKRKLNLMIGKYNVTEPRTPGDRIATFKVFRRNRGSSECLSLQVMKLLRTALTTKKELDPAIIRSKKWWKNQPKNLKRKRKSVSELRLAKLAKFDGKVCSSSKVEKVLSWRLEGGASRSDEKCPGSGDPTPRNECSLPQTPEAFRQGARGPFRQHDPREFGLTKEERFVHPRHVIPNLTFQPPDEGPRQRDLPIEPSTNVTTRDLPGEVYSFWDIAERQAQTLGLTAPIHRAADQIADTGRAVRHQLPDIRDPAFVSTLRQDDLNNPTRLYQDLLVQGHSCWDIAKLNWNILERGNASQRLLDLPVYSPKSEPKKSAQAPQTYEQIIDFSDEQLSPSSILDCDTPPDITRLSFLACLRTDELANPNKLVKKLKRRGYRDLEIARFQRNLLELNMSGSQPQVRPRQQELAPVFDENIQNISAPSFASPPDIQSRTRDFHERNLECLSQEQIFDVTAPSFIEHAATNEDITDPRFIASIHPDDIANLPRFINELEMQGYSKIQIARLQRNLLQSDLARSPAFSETPRQLFSARQEQHRTPTTPCIPLERTDRSLIESQVPLVTAAVESGPQRPLPDILSPSFLSSIPPEDIRNPERLITDLYNRGYKSADIARFQEALLRLSGERFPEIQLNQSMRQLESTSRHSPHDQLQYEDRPDITHLSFLACLRTDELENPCQLINEFESQGYTECEIAQFRKNLLQLENSGSRDGQLPDVTSPSFLASIRPEDIKSPQRLFDDLYNRGYKPADIARLQQALLQLSGEKFTDVQVTPQQFQPIRQSKSMQQPDLREQLPSEERPDITSLSFLACLRTEDLENPCQLINQFEQQGYAKWEIAKFQRNLLQLDISGMDSKPADVKSLSPRQKRTSETMQNLRQDRLEDISAPSFMAAPTPPHTPTRERLERAMESAPCEQIENLSPPSFLATASPPPDITDPRFISTIHPQDIANLPRFIHELESQGYSKIQIARLQRNLLHSDLARSRAFSETPQQFFSARQEQHRTPTTPCIPLERTDRSLIESQVPLVTAAVESGPQRPLPDILSPSFLSSIPPEDIRNPERLITDLYNRGYKSADIARFQEALLRLSGETFSGFQPVSKPITPRVERVLDISAPSPVEQPFWRTKCPQTFEQLLDSTTSQFDPNEQFQVEERPDITHLSFLACLRTEEMENPCQLIKDFERQGYTKCEIAKFAKNLLSLDKAESDVRPTQEKSQSSRHLRPFEHSQDLQEGRLEDISAPSFIATTSSPFTPTSGQFHRMMEWAPDEQIENMSAPSFLATAGPLPDITDPSFVGTVHPEEIQNLPRFIHDLELQGYSKVQIARFQRNLMQADIARTQTRTETPERILTPEVQSHGERLEDRLEDVKEEETVDISPQPVLQNFVPNPSQKIQALRDRACQIALGIEVHQIFTTPKDVELPDITSQSFLASIRPEDIRSPQRLFDDLYNRGYQPADIARLQEALLQLSGGKFRDAQPTTQHTQLMKQIKPKQQPQLREQLQSEERPDIKNLSFLACLRTEELENPCQIIEKFERQGYTQGEIAQFRKNLLKFQNLGSGDGQLPDVTSPSFLASIRPEDIKSPQRLFDDLYNRGYKPADIARLQHALLQLSGEKFTDVQVTPQQFQPIRQSKSMQQPDLREQLPSEERPDITSLSFLACLRTEDLENPCQLINQFEQQGYAKWEIAKFQRNLLQLDISGMDSKPADVKSLSPRQKRTSETMQNLRQDRLEDISAPSFMAAPTPPHTPTRERLERAMESAPCEQIENLSAPSFLATASPPPDITDPRFISTIHPQNIANLPRFIHELEMQGYSKIQIARLQRNLLQSDLARSPAFSETPRQLFSARQEQHRTPTTPCIPLERTDRSLIESQVPLVTAAVESGPQRPLPDILSPSFLSSIPPEDIRNPERLITDLYNRGYKSADIARFQEALLRLSGERFPEIQLNQSMRQLESTSRHSPHDQLQYEDRPDITHLSFLACLRTDELENPCQLINEFERQGYTECEIAQFRKNLLKLENSGSGDGQLPDVTSPSFLASIRPEDIKSPQRLFDDLYNRGYKPADIARLQHALLQLSGEKFTDVQVTPQQFQPIRQLKSMQQPDLREQLPSEERPDITSLSFLACLRTEEMENPCQLINQFEQQGYAKWEIAKFQRNLLQLNISGMDSRPADVKSPSSRQKCASENMQNLRQDRLEDISAPSFMAAPTPPHTPTRERFKRAIESAPCEQIENLSAPSFLANAGRPPDITDPCFVGTIKPEDIEQLPRFIRELEVQGYSKVEIAILQRNLLKADILQRQGQPGTPEEVPVIGGHIKPQPREQFKKILDCLPDDRLEDVSVPSFNETRPSLQATPNRGILPSVTSPSFLASLAPEDINNPENLYRRLYSQGYSCFDIAKLQRLILELPAPEIIGEDSVKIRKRTASSKRTSIRQYPPDQSAEDRPNITRLSFLACLRSEDLENPVQFVEKLRKQGYKEMELATFQRNLLRLDVPSASRSSEARQTSPRKRESHLEDVSAPSFMAAPSPPYTPTRERLREAIECAPDERIEDLSAPSFLVAADPLPDITDPRYIDTIHPEDIKDLPKVIRELEMQGHSKMQLARFHLNLLRRDIERSQQQVELPEAPQQTQIGRLSQKVLERLPDERLQLDPLCPVTTPTPSNKTSQIRQYPQDQFSDQRPDITQLSFLACLDSKDLEHPSQLIKEFSDKGYNAMELAIFQRNLLRLEITTASRGSISRQRAPEPVRVPQDHKQSRKIIECLPDEQIQNVSVPAFDKTPTSSLHTAARRTLPDVTSPSFLASIAPDDIINPEKLYQRLYNQGYTPFDIAKVQELLLELSGRMHDPGTSRPVRAPTTSPKTTQIHQYPQDQSSVQRPDITHISFLACLRTEDLENQSQLVEDFRKQGYNAMELAIFQRNLLRLDVPSASRSLEAMESSYTQMPLTFTYNETPNFSREVPLEDISAPSFIAGPSPPYTPTRERFERVIASAPCEQIGEISAPSFSASAGPLPDITNPNFIANLSPDRLENVSQLISEFTRQGYTQLQITRFQRNLINAQMGLPPPTARTSASPQVAENEATANQSTPLPEIFNGNCVIDLPDENQRISNFRDAFETLENYAPLNVQLGNDKRFVSKLRRPTKLTLIPKMRSPKSFSTLGLSKIPTFKPRPFLQSTGNQTANRQQRSRFDPKPPTLGQTTTTTTTRNKTTLPKPYVKVSITSNLPNLQNRKISYTGMSSTATGRISQQPNAPTKSQAPVGRQNFPLRLSLKPNRESNTKIERPPFRF